MSQFIVTTRDKSITLSELHCLIDKYAEHIHEPFSRSNFCQELISWIENSFDTSFSNIRGVIDDCHAVIEQRFFVHGFAWNRITRFIFNDWPSHPFAKNWDDWPSCKDLLQFSDKDIVEQASDFIHDDRTRQNIRSILKIDTAINTFSVGMLTLYYLDLWASIEKEILICPTDSYDNKKKLRSKFLQELNFCHLVLCRTGEKIAADKIKELQEAQKKHKEQLYQDPLTKPLLPPPRYQG